VPVHPPTRTLRERPDLDQLKRQAKELLDGFVAGEPSAVAEVNAHYRGADAITFALHDALLVVARAHGFASWPKLKAFVDGVTVSRLAQAVRAGDVAGVRSMLERRPELVHTDLAEIDEHRALHYAVLARSPEMVGLLMSHGADPRKGIWPHRAATAALALAADRGYDEIVEAIREEEARRRPESMRSERHPLPLALPDWVGPITPAIEPQAMAMLEANPGLVHARRPNDEATALHLAASMLLERVCAWLLEHGADVNARARWGATPLEVVGLGCDTSSTSEQAGRVRDLLLAHGAIPTPRWAVATGNGTWLRDRHAEGALVNEISEVGGLLRAAVVHDRPDMLSLLLELGLDPDERVQAGAAELSGMPLKECVRARKYAMADMLIAGGARLTPDVAVALGKADWIRTNYAGSRAAELGAGLITIAVEHDRPEMLALLLDLGLDPDERVRLDGLEEPVYSWGGALRHCAGAGKLQMAATLLARGADPNTGVYAASSAMVDAYSRGDTVMLELLERHGGFLKAGEVGWFGLTDRAAGMLAEESEGRLRDGAVAPGETVAPALLWSGADAGHPEIVRLALTRLDWARDDPRWHGMLMRVLGGHPVAERERYFTCLRLMLERCDPSVRGGAYRATLLHDVAASWPHTPSSPEERVALARMLLDSGARTDLRDDLLESTPLGWACRWGRVELVQLLLEHGVDPVEPDAKPWATPRAWARKTGQDSILAMLGR
jgi:ankyrin repeat protein